MSCVVGVIHDGKVWMGGDSAVTVGNEQYRMAFPKIFQVGDALIGMVGSLRFQEIVMAEDKGLVTEDLMGIVGYADWLRDFAQEIGAADKDGDLPSRLLIGVDGQLFSILEDGCVIQTDDKFAAIGSGDQMALGYLSALGKVNPSDAIHNALGTVAYYDSTVCEPFTVLSL